MYEKEKEYYARFDFYMEDCLDYWNSTVRTEEGIIFSSRYQYDLPEERFMLCLDLYREITKWYDCSPEKAVAAAIGATIAKTEKTKREESLESQRKEILRKAYEKKTLSETAIICPSCGKTNQMKSRFCGACGLKIQKPCPSCGEEQPITAKFCGKCGICIR